MKRIIISVVLVFVMLVSASFFSACSHNEIIRQPYFINEESFDGKTFPFVYVDVENDKDIVSKEEYLSCLVRITNTQEEYVFDGENIQTAKIKGRGNSSWEMPKKSYKLKFDSKVNLFGFGKAKKYTLIANFCDKSLSRNMMAYELARLVGLSETSYTQPVNLILNGEFYGVYLLCEQNEIGKNRVNIESDLNDIDTGYLIELDERACQEGIENYDYFVSHGNQYAIKDPETDDVLFSAEHMNFIHNYVDTCLNKLCLDDYDEIDQLIDVESFAKCYLIHEVFSCEDVGFSSFYLYKKAGGKLYAGPVWDFDISSGNCDYGDGSMNDTSFMYAKFKNIWYNKLLNFQEFRLIVKNLIDTYYDGMVAKIDEVVAYQLEYEDNNNAEFEVWPTMGKYVWPNTDEIVSITTFRGQIDYLSDWVKEKLNYMQEEYCN